MKTVNAIVVILVALVMMCGCSSKYIGLKLGAERNEEKPIVDTGIPFVMNRPEFQLTVAETKVENKPVVTSTIGVKWVPDNNQRYTLSLDPALFVASSFELVFDGKGNLASSTATTKSQVVQTIRTLGELGIAAFDLASSAAFDVSSPVKQLRDRIEVSPHAECTEARKDGHSGIFANIPSDNTDVRSAIVWRWNRYEKIGESTSKGDGDKEVLKRIHYVNKQELNCFRKIYEDISTESDAKIKELKEEFDNLKNVFKTTHKGNINYAKVIALIDERNLVKLKERTSEIADADSPTVFEENEDELLVTLVFIIQEENNVQKQVLDAIINMKEPMWRARHVLEYSDHIKSSLKKAMLLSPGSAERDTELAHRKTLNTELDFILGTTDLRKQIINLEAYLARELPGPEVGANVQPYPVEGRESVSAQLVALQGKYETVRERILGAVGMINVGMPLPEPVPHICPKPPPPTAALELVKNLVIPRATPGFVMLKKEELPEDAPSYVLVLEPADGLPLLSTPKGEN
ncbi:MAG: hypothetical protein GY797_41225 [Deltaproteobacteria bacterium]|nr:hypothetical protein [Deltaproteobacteria bacterium]